MERPREMNFAPQNTVLMLTSGFPPISCVGVFRPLRFAKYLPESNWSSVVLTRTPESGDRIDLELSRQIPKWCHVSRVPIHRPEEQLRSLFTRSKRKTKKIQSDKISSSAIPQPSRSRKLRNQITELAFAMPDQDIAWKNTALARGLQLIAEHKVDAIFATAPRFSVLLLARTLAKRTRLPLIIDFRDPWVRNPWGPRNKSKVANKIAVKLERKTIQAATKVILNTERLRRDFTEHYGEEAARKFTCIPNGYDPDLRVSVEEIIRKASIKRNKRFHLLHTGNLYRNRDPRPVIKAISILQKRGLDIHFEQLGQVEDKSGVEQLIKSLGLHQTITLSPPVPHVEMLDKMAAADAFLLIQPGTSLQVPGKLFEMLLFRKPLVATAPEGALTEIIERNRVGFASDAHSPEKIADAIEQATSDEATPDAAWNSVLRQFDGAAHAKQLANLLNDSISENNARR